MAIALQAISRRERPPDDKSFLVAFAYALDIQRALFMTEP